MSKTSTKPPSGMRDFLPLDVIRRQHVTDVIRSVYEAHGFLPLETPAIENLNVLLGKYGAEGDQLLYRILHRRDALTRALESDDLDQSKLADQGLRYDLTIPLARVRAQYQDLPRYFKRYQIQPVWRADRPGRGRFREFYQCDVDITGTKSALAEAEVCSAVAQVLLQLGFDNFQIRINSRVLLSGLIAAANIPPELEESALIAIDKLDKIGPEGVLKELNQRGIESQAAASLLEIFECESARDDTDIATHLAARLADGPGRAALDELLELSRMLECTPAAGHHRLSPTLARGLGYYTGPIFEIEVDDLAGSLGGGGRYDNLIGMFGKQEVPAVGFSIGLERILLVMEEREMFPALGAGADVLLCWSDVESGELLSLARELRAAGLKVELIPEAAKLKKQLAYADNAGTAFAAILGADEQAAGELTVKHLAQREQERLPRADAIETLCRWRTEAAPDRP